MPDFNTGFQWQVFNVAGTYGGVAGTRDLNFYNSFFGGGMTIPGPPFALDFSGPQLYSGSTTTPSFTPGIHALSLDGLSYTLTITTAAPSVPGGVPEPSTWAMMLIGFGLAGAGLRRGRQVAKVRFGF